MMGGGGAESGPPVQSTLQKSGINRVKTNNVVGLNKLPLKLADFFNLSKEIHVQLLSEHV